MTTDTAAPADIHYSSDTPARALHEQLQVLRAEVIAQADRQLERFRDGYPDGEFSPSALNLARYLALRRFDLRPLQESLAALGVSSLGRCEAHVLSSLDRVIDLLDGKPGPGGEPGSCPVSPLHAGRQTLAINTRRILGPRPAPRDTRIMVTLPADTADDYPMIRQLVDAGMDCARINCAHDDSSVWERLVNNVRRAESESGRACRILMDLGGHKIRTGPLATLPGVLHIKIRKDRYGHPLAPAAVVLTPPEAERETKSGEESSLRFRLPVSRELHDVLQAGDRLSLLDARGRQRLLTVARLDAQGNWRAECETGAYLCDETVLHLERPGRAGEYMRLGAFPAGPFARQGVDILLRNGDRLLLSAQPVSGRPAAMPDLGDLAEHAVIGCSHPGALSLLLPGQPVWIDDGKIGGTVERVGAEGAMIRIHQAGPKGSRLLADKGINFPGADLGLSGLSDRDRRDLDFVCAHADMVGFSFVESLADMDELIEELHRRGATQLAIIAKIETRRAVENLPEIILGTMGRYPLGVMIARGDLAVELGGERLAEIQEEILWLCEAAHIPVIWATQVLETLTKKGAINRAELTDAAMSGRAECVMLNKGAYILQAVKALDDILSRIGNHQYKKFSRYRALHW